MSSEKLIEMTRLRKREDATLRYHQMIYDAQRWFQCRMVDIEELYLKELAQLPIIIKTKWGILFG